MAEVEEFRCFVGGLSWNTTDKGLEEEFRRFGNVLEAKVCINPISVFLFAVRLTTQPYKSSFPDIILFSLVVRLVVAVCSAFIIVIHIRDSFF